MTSVRFRVGSLARWTPDDEPDTTKAMPLSLRRRVTGIGQHALAAAWPLSGPAPDGPPEPPQPKIVLSSRHGEFGRTISLLEAVVKNDELSPADFSLSVHHALTGLLSIARKNRSGHVAVASGEESFCYGLIEAATSLAEDPHTPILLIHYDEPLKAPFESFNEKSDRTLVIAASLAAAHQNVESGVTFGLAMESVAAGAKPSLSHAEDFMGFIGGDAPEFVSLGQNHQWRWTRYAGS